MNDIDVVTTLLENPEVKGYFLSVLKSNLPAESKYQQFVEFFKMRRRLESEFLNYSEQLDEDNQEKRDRIISEAAQKIGIWNPDKILQDTEHGIRTAINWIITHQDLQGGWGYDKGSNVWGTAYAVLALSSVKKVLEFDSIELDSIELCINKGVEWLKNHHQDWNVAEVPLDEERVIYDASIAVRCLSNTDEQGRNLISLCNQTIAMTQREDGSWGRSVYGEHFSKISEILSEPGATSMALQALAEDKNPSQFQSVIEKGINWLLSFQNENNGSWSDNTSDDPEIRNKPSINKTCDSMKGILAGRIFKLNKKYQSKISKGMYWLLQQEQLLEETGNIKGWKYEGPKEDESSPDLVSTCLILETFVQIDEVSLPALTANVYWLLESQEKTNDIEKGKWARGDTYRITYALINYYNRIRKSPLFRPLDDTNSKLV